MKKIWFVATIITKCEIEGASSIDELTCSQDIFVIHTSSREEAYERAIEIGKSQEQSYLNANGQKVLWKFLGLENLEELPHKVIRDGVEIWGRIFHSNDPDALVVKREGLSVFYQDEIKNLTAAEIIGEGFETKLICNRVSTASDDNRN